MESAAPYDAAAAPDGLPSRHNPLIGRTLSADTLNNVVSLLVVAQTVLAYGPPPEETLADGLFVLLECAAQALEYEVERSR